ncbi:P63C domain-containing protein [Maritalea mobilis]|uniref:P63C domain-containing protein n=1 Tax=Maritalea mobilis TaxID=483324 RepID=UPI001C9635E0|nr:P63C domain-containing protein [Maritalea mobilis]MBY6201017.1 P63C domain-containing protein [Maritalea mobilis]
MPEKKNLIEPIPDAFESVADAMLGKLKSNMRKTVAGAPHTPIQIGETEIECYVLDDETRVLTQATFLEAMGRHRKANVRKEGGEEQLPAILQGKSIKPFISKELLEKSRPIHFHLPSGAVASGYRAEILPMVCEVFLQARDADVLPHNQRHIAQKAEVLVRALAQVGIIALVDEATGYQLDRSHQALRILLSKYIAEGLQKWIQTFPAAFFGELDRLYGNDTSHGKRPQYYGKFINKYVYEPLENGYVKKELDRLNITDEGKRRARFHQWLNQDGRNMLIHQIGRVQGLMEMCTDIEHFKAAAKKQKTVSIAPFLFDEMNKIIE